MLPSALSLDPSPRLPLPPSSAPVEGGPSPTPLRTPRPLYSSLEAFPWGPGARGAHLRRNATRGPSFALRRVKSLRPHGVAHVAIHQHVHLLTGHLERLAELAFDLRQ